jgi:hypothetical protein
LELTAIHQAFDGVLAPRYEFFDQQVVMEVAAFGADVWRLQKQPHPFERGNERVWIISAYDAATPRQGDRLDDDRIDHRPRHLAWRRIDGGGRETGDRQTSRLEALAGVLLVPGGRRRLYRMTREPERFTDPGGNYGRAIADNNDASKRMGPSLLQNVGDGRLFIMKPDRNRLVAPGILNHVAAIGGEHQLHAKTLGSLTKRPRLVPGCRSQKENSQISLISSGFGSAQQYHGSSKNGTDEAPAAVEGGGASPA